MTMTFFFKVTDTGKKPTQIPHDPLLITERLLGSWLEIGQSITFFCIASLLLVWSAGICAAGEFLMGDTLSYRDGLKED
jgi:GPI ethanolamine phosphate transferase 1